MFLTSRNVVRLHYSRTLQDCSGHFEFKTLWSPTMVRFAIDGFADKENLCFLRHFHQIRVERVSRFHISRNSLFVLWRLLKRAVPYTHVQALDTREPHSQAIFLSF